MADQVDSLTPEGAAAADAGSRAKVERRRPGRTEYVNPSLLALLRGGSACAANVAGPAAGDFARADVGSLHWEQEDPPDDLAPARGVMFALVAIIPFWTGLAAFAWWLFDW